jgi:hypothetical protein
LLVLPPLGRYSRRQRHEHFQLRIRRKLVVRRRAQPASGNNRKESLKVVHGPAARQPTQSNACYENLSQNETAEQQQLPKQSASPSRRPSSNKIPSSRMFEEPRKHKQAGIKYTV